ncbi:hypothetical protein Tco_0013387 [Tanacetum coccineum]
MAYWGFLGVGTTLDIFQHIILIPYLEYGVLSPLDTAKPPFEKTIINTDYKIKTSLEEPLTDLELKPLPDNLEYVFLEEPSFLSVIISSKLFAQNKSKLVSVLKKHKEAFAWKTTNIPGICPSFCKHKILLLDDKKPVIQKQRRLNPSMQEVVKKEIVKLLDTGIIYPIADSPWVSPIHCVLKKGGITVVTIENDELVPTRTITGWRVCIDYRKLNEATAKDHFPLPFMDQICMLEIFHGMIEESVKLFMDDFSGFGDSFDKCLTNLDKMLQRCKDAHLVLNLEKSHFMVKERIMLGRKVSGAGLEVDKAKIDIISKLPPLLISKGNVVADALSRKERVEPKRVRAMNMTLQLSIKDMILVAQKEASDKSAGLQRGLNEMIERRSDGALYYLD